MKKSGLFLVFLVFKFTSSLGQHVLPDSIKNILYDLSPKEQIEHLHQLVVSTWLNYPKESMMYAEEAIKISDTLGDIRLHSKSIRLKGGVHYGLGNYDSSLFYTRKSLMLAVQLEDTTLINNSLNNLGLVNYNMGNYQNALEYLLRSLRLKELIGEIYGRSLTLNNVGLVYNKLKDYSRAREYFEAALSFSRQHDQPNLQLYSLANLAGTYLGQDVLDSAYTLYKSAIDLQVDNKNWNSAVLSGLGQLYLKRKEFDSARVYFGQSLRLKEEVGDKNGASEVYYFYARLAQALSEYDSAFMYLEKSQDLARMIGSKERMFDNYELYVQLHSRLGNIMEAFQYQTMLLNLRDELFNENMARNLVDIQVELQQEESREILNRKERQLSNSKRFVSFLTITVVFTAVLLIIIFFAYRNNMRINKILGNQNDEIRSQKEEIASQKESLLHKNTELEDAHRIIQDQNQKLERLNSHLLETVDIRTRELQESTERLKIANLELNNFIYKSSHDIKGPLATLMGVCNVALKDIDEPQAKKYFQMLWGTAKRLNDILARLKTVSDVNSLELKPRKIEFSNIVKECIEQVKNIEGIERVNVEYMIEEGIYYEGDPFLIDLIIFNMIHNAIRFQESTESNFLKVSIICENNQVILHFLDNGIGIEKEDSENIFHMYSKSAVKHQSLGLGLYLVKECVKKLGGDIMLVGDEELTHFRIALPRY